MVLTETHRHRGRVCQMVRSLGRSFRLCFAGLRKTGFQLFDIHVLQNGREEQLLNHTLLVILARNVLAMLTLQSGDAHIRVG